MTEFLDEFRTDDPDELDRAFKAVRGTCTEFPTPAHVRLQLKKSASRVQHEMLLAESNEILGRGIKPPGWVPLADLKAELSGKGLCSFPAGNDMTPEQIVERIANLKKQAGVE